MTFKKQPVGVLGAGRSGQAAAQLLARQGAHVLLSESQSLPRPKKLPSAVQWESGKHSENLLQSVLIIRSPGIPNHLPILQQVRRKKIPIWSELELASRLIHPKKIVAITGTNGKTTTTTLVGELFKASNRSTFVAGNIGTPLSDYAGRVPRNAAVILEASSYQLENIELFHPTISAILNITPDHLEHHGSMQAYTAAKARIFENQTRMDVCVLNYDDPRCRALAKKVPAKVFFFSRKTRLSRGVFFESGTIYYRWAGKSESFPLEWNLPGLHNAENALAAVAMAIAGGVPVTQIRKVLKRFKGVEHRLEVVRHLRGVQYINDSKATNVDSTRVALESFDRPLRVIMGGRGKGTPYTSLQSLAEKHVRELLLIGEDAARIEKDLGKIVRCRRLHTLKKAVQYAGRVAQPGEVVLLSPACASFDQYNNYEERGRDFKQWVRKLK